MNMLLPLPGVLSPSSISAATLAPSTSVNQLLPNYGARTTWPDVINHRNLAEFFLDGAHIICNCCRRGRTRGKLRMRHKFCISVWYEHLKTLGHKNNFSAWQLTIERGDGTKIAGSDQALTTFFSATGKGSRYAKPSPKKKMRKTSTNPSSSSYTDSGCVPVDDSEDLIVVDMMKGLDATEVVATQGKTATSDAEL